MGRKVGDSAPFLEEGSWVPIEHKVAWAEAHLHSKRHLDQSSRLVTIDTGQKLGAVYLLGELGWDVPLSGELRPHVTQCGLG